ncbi:hypothetical protein PSDI105340_04595 [Pseudoalteromonas distincta]
MTIVCTVPALSVNVTDTLSPVFKPDTVPVTVTVCEAESATGSIETKGGVVSISAEIVSLIGLPTGSVPSTITVTGPSATGVGKVISKVPSGPTTTLTT